MRFANRVEAGKLLAAALAQYRDADTVVLALPRGGVVLGAEVAKALGLPLDLVIARKIGHPGNPEYALGAVTEDGQVVADDRERARVDPEWFAGEVARERLEATRRHHDYLAGRAPVSLEGKTAILVDDGIATGLTMLAAIRQVQARKPRRIVVAIPVIPPETANRLASEVDDVVALEIPDFFLGAVGAYYADFSQVSDDEVLNLLRTDPPLLFSLPTMHSLADLLTQSGLLQADCRIARFPNGEIYISVPASARNQTCLVLGTLAPPDAQLLAMLLLCHALHGEGAARVIALLPYLAYMRQDRPEAGRSLATAWLGGILPASGIDEVVTVDIHSPHAAMLLPVRLTDLSPASLFAEVLLRDGLREATLVAPDEGAIARAEAVRVAAGVTVPIAHLVKQRTATGVSSTLQGTVSRRAVVVDDLLDTGGTLLACCAALQRAGTEEITIMVTHALFTGSAWQQLWELGVRRIYCTDTVPLPPSIDDARIEVLSIEPLIVPWVKALANIT